MCNLKSLNFASARISGPWPGLTKVPSITLHGGFESGLSILHPDRSLPLNNETGFPHLRLPFRLSVGALRPVHCHGVPSCPVVFPTNTSPTNLPSKTISSLRSSSSLGDTNVSRPSESSILDTGRALPHRLTIVALSSLPSCSISSQEGYSRCGVFRVRSHRPRNGLIDVVAVEEFALADCPSTETVAAVTAMSNTKRPLRHIIRCTSPGISKPVLFRSTLRLDGLRNRIPVHRAFSEVRLVRHVTGKCCIVAEHGVLKNRLAGAHGLKKLPQVRPEIVVVIPFVAGGFGHRLLSRLRIVFFVPLPEVSILQPTGQAITVITWGQVDTKLWRVGDAELRKFNDPLRTHESGRLSRFRSQGQSHVDRDVCVLEQNCVHIRHVAAVLPAVDSTKRCRSLWNLVPTENGLHAADQVHKQVARYSCAVLFPTPPAGERVRIERFFRSSSQPGVPVQVLRRQVCWRGILPRAGWIVAAECRFHKAKLTDRTVVVEFLRFGAKN